MKKSLLIPRAQKSGSYLLGLLLVLLFTVSCYEEEGPQPTGTENEYILNSVGASGVSGTVKFEALSNQTIRITLSLMGTSTGGNHPAHIHANSAATGGGILIDLNNVNGATGESITEISAFNDGTSLSYQELIGLDAHVNVHQSPDDMGTLIAQGNIGVNVPIDGGGEEPVDDVNYSVTNSGSSAYLFTGNGISEASNPDITLQRGQTYTFTINAPGHPFYINTAQGTGTANAYDSGVTNNGVASGNVTFTVPDDAPDQLFYNCEFHSSMTGVLTITD